MLVQSIHPGLTGIAVGHSLFCGSNETVNRVGHFVEARFLHHVPSLGKFCLGIALGGWNLSSFLQTILDTVVQIVSYDFAHPAKKFPDTRRILWLCFDGFTRASHLRFSRLLGRRNRSLIGILCGNNLIVFVQRVISVSLSFPNLTLPSGLAILFYPLFRNQARKGPIVFRLLRPVRTTPIK